LLQLFRGLAELLQIATIENVDPHGVQSQQVNRKVDAVDAGGYDIASPIAAEHGNVAILEPLGARGMQPRGPLFVDVPSAGHVTPCPAAGINENNVAAGDFDFGLFFPGIQVFRVNGCSWFQITDATELGNIEQDAALLASEDNDFLIRMGVSRKLLTEVMYQQKAVASGSDDKSTRRCLTSAEAIKYNVANAQ